MEFRSYDKLAVIVALAGAKSACILLLLGKAEIKSLRCRQKMFLTPLLNHRSLCLVWRKAITPNGECIETVSCLSTNSEDDKPEILSQNKKLPPEPQNCCMSGCSNCVWVQYAEEVAKLLKDDGETAKKKIMEQVKDPNLRAFLMLELSHLFKKK